MIVTWLQNQANLKVRTQMNRVDITDGKYLARDQAIFINLAKVTILQDKGV